MNFINLQIGFQKQTGINLWERRRVVEKQSQTRINVNNLQNMALPKLLSYTVQKGSVILTPRSSIKKLRRPVSKKSRVRNIERLLAFLDFLVHKKYTLTLL